MLRRLRHSPRAPLAVAGLLGIPLFFSALMAFSLRLEKPRLVAGHPQTPTSGTEAAIWLAALAAPIALVLVGALATLIPRGVVVSALAAIAASLLVMHRLGAWERLHTRRYPLGADLIGGQSSTLSQGQWEANARHAAQQLGVWTIVLAVAAIAIVVLRELWRRRHPIAAPPPELPPEEATAQSQIVRPRFASRWFGGLR